MGWGDEGGGGDLLGWGMRGPLLNNKFALIRDSVNVTLIK